MFIIRCKDSGVQKCVSRAMARKNWPASPRQSPVAGGHYAGCKWTEPPLPSALPPPPQHWMQAPHARLPLRPPQPQPLDAQLKVLLKVRA